MKTGMKLKLALGAIAVGVMSQTVEAKNPDSIVVSVTPTVSYSVVITSPMVNGYDFGTVALGFSTISTVAIGVQNDGTVAEYLSLAITNTAPGNWAPAGTAAADTFRLSGRFAATQPVDSAFVVADD